MRRFILSTLVLGFASVASAQAPAGPGWAAFTGCWTPVGADGERNIAANTPRVCVVPSGANAATLLTVVKDTVTERTVVDASGARREVSKQGCSGWEKAEFSSDGRRLYLSGEQTCAGGLKRKTSGVFAIASNGDWINAVDVSADSVSSVRVMRYASSAVTPAMPAEIREPLLVNEVSDRTARISAQREVTVNAVIEASRFLSAPAEEAWLAELEQDFNLDEKTLVRLADENVAPSVIDVLVAVSNPELFSVRPTGAVTRNEDSDSVRVRRTHAPCFAPVVDPWAWYAYDPCDPYLRYSFYRSRYYRYGYPYYGYGYYDPYYYGPVIIVKGGPSAPVGHGRMTKDGYKRDPEASGGSGRSSGGSSTSSSSGRTATKKGSDSAPKEKEASGSSSGSSGSSSSGSSSSGSSSSGSSGRTATRKPPA